MAEKTDIAHVTLQDLQPGRLVYIPAGAALSRERPLALIIGEATPAKGLPGDVRLDGQVLRADGSNPYRYKTAWFIATIDKLRIAPPGIRRCAAAHCPASYHTIAMRKANP
ncbi:hypothetical protein ACIBKY_03570 [Nonomuraea sp. NPDC050394]|uniref:hypothetical protein n=1 Tax=Nonomuraea sp. NPDC050394 TaxID=3364363 RepID=UPI0037A92944